MARISQDLVKRAHLDRVSKAKAKAETASVVPPSAPTLPEETIKKPNETEANVETETDSEDVRRS